MPVEGALITLSASHFLPITSNIITDYNGNFIAKVHVDSGIAYTI